MQKILSKEDILSASDLKTETVDVPEWGGSVIVRTMTGAERDEFQSSIVTINTDGTSKTNMEGMREKFLASTMVDEMNNQLFTPEDVTALSNKSAAALDRVFNVAQTLNGLGVGSMEESIKNSAPGQSDASSSAPL